MGTGSMASLTDIFMTAVCSAAGGGVFVEALNTKEPAMAFLGVLIVAAAAAIARIKIPSP